MAIGVLRGEDMMMTLNNTPENIALDQAEWIDMVDDNNVVVGRITRDEALTKGIYNVRTAAMFIKNTAGQLLVMRRAAHKRIAPSGLDFSASGFVQSGQTYDEAMRTEIREELGAAVDCSAMRQLGIVSPRDGAVSFAAIYEMQGDIVPAYNSDDFVGYEWLAPAELAARLEAGAVAKANMLPALQRFYLG